MLIKALTLENFKGIRDQVRIEFKPITLLFGPNSAGKSTILQALVYAREILERHNLDPDRTLLGGEWMDLGGFRNLVHRHDRSRKIRIGFSFNLLENDLPVYLTDFQRAMMPAQDQSADRVDDWFQTLEEIDVCLTIAWSELRNSPFVEALHVHADNHQVARITSSPDGRSVLIDYLDLAHNYWMDDVVDVTSDSDRNGLVADLIEALGSRLFQDGRQANIPLANQLDALPHVGEQLQLAPDVWLSSGDPDFTSTMRAQVYLPAMLSSLIVGPLELARRNLDKLLYIGPLREIPSRNPLFSRSPDVSRWSRGTAAWDVLHDADDSFLAQVNNWLAEGDRLNTGYYIQRNRFRELPIDHPITVAISQNRVLDEVDLANLLDAVPIATRMGLRHATSELELAPQDVGVGVSQILPVVVAALYHRSGILAIEQPELHIHPAMQVALGDLFAAQLRGGDATFLLETHSEHLMLRFLRRIRETTDGELPPGCPDLHPEDVAVLYIENGSEGFKVTRLRVDADGEFEDRWPAGFFPERMQELI